MNHRTIGRGAVALALLLAPGAALAQGQPMYQSGTVTPNHLLKSAGNGQQMDAGGTAGDANGKGVSPFSITDSLGLGLCSNSAATGGQHYEFCLGHDSSGNALLSVSANGGAAERTAYLVKNGASYEIPFVGQGSGNMVGPNSSTVDNLACFNNVSGTLTKVCDTTSSRFKGTTALSGLQTVNTPTTGRFGGYAQNLITVNDTAHTTEVVAPYAPPIIGFETDLVTGGLTNSDTTHTAGVFYSALVDTPNTAAGKQEYWQGIYTIAGGNASAGGTAGLEKGMAWGINSEVNLYSPATYWYALTGAEIDMRVQAGASVVQRLGVWVADIGTGSQGSGTVDCAFCSGVGPSSQGFKNGWLITNFAGGGQNFTNNLIYADHLFNVANIINLSNVGCTGDAALIFNSGTGIDCDGAFITTFGAIDYNGNGGFLTVQNNQNSSFDVRLNAGAGTSEAVSLTFADNGATKWSIQKLATSHDFRITDLVTTDPILVANTSGVLTFGEANGSTGVQLVLDRAGTAKITHLPTVGAGTGKRFLCIDGSDFIYVGTGASCV